jgi:pimeloyl-ACP methyl ester carboxylesterase
MKQLLAKLIGLYINLLVYFSPRKAGELGFSLFCTPQGIPLKDHQRKFLDSSEKSSFLCDGLRIQVYRWGSGKKRILFLHGWQSHTFRWKNYIESLSKEEFTIYAFDAPGHGNSGGKYLNLPIYSQALETFLNLVGPVDSIVGHSLGSFTALYTFHRLESAPAQELILTATPGEVSEFLQFYRDFLGLSHRTEIAIRNTFKRFIDNFPEYFSASRFAAKVNVKGLIIHDIGDFETPILHAHAVHRAWKQSALITTSGLGHNLRSATVVKHVVEFLSQSGQPGLEVRPSTTYYQSTN